ncbi:hypothetical protein JTE90_028607 [Oedothorax gibbosus]|uniref:MADF domain-containing protein n=1 Tax=Oedothorax gibbosus TaxID=931172 RepID=A0AAV6TX56_9ARAC|nr:hypothetical protein JTE90_028607 [Oedothorax gibbosus]
MAAESTAKWTAEMEQILIDTIKENRQLWDTKNKFYKLKHLKSATWEEVKQKMMFNFPEHQALFTVDAMKAKFTNLKTVFQRNKNRIKSLASGMGSEGYAVPWIHFTRMQFLDICEAEESTSNLQPEASSSSATGVLDYSFQSSHRNDQMLDESAVGEVCLEPPNKKPKKRQTPEDELLAKACEALQAVSSEKSDAETSFGQYVTHKLKLIKPQSKRNDCEQEIVGILMQYLIE